MLEPIAGAPERVTVQVVEADAVKVVLAHCKEEGLISMPMIVSVVVLLVPFRDAVIVAL
jgi:hypothetical protein